MFSLFRAIRLFHAGVRNDLTLILKVLKMINMNQQEELDAIDAIDAKLTAVQSGVMGLESKISDLESTIAAQGAFVPQAVADKLTALKAHVTWIATSLGVAPVTTDSPSGDSPAAVGDSPVAAVGAMSFPSATGTGTTTSP